MKKNSLLVMAALAALSLVVAAVANACSVLNPTPTPPPVRPVPKGYYNEFASLAGRLRVDTYITSADKYIWEKYGMLNFEVKVTNTSNQTLERAELVYSLYNGVGVVVEKDKLLPGNVISNLGPGQTVIINSKTGDVGLIQKISKYELVFRNIEFGADPNLYSVANLPADLKTPGKVLAAYFCLTAKIDYEGAINLISAAIKDQFPAKSVWETDNAKPWSLRFASVEIVKEYIYENYARVELKINYQNGERWPVTMKLILENGGWKIANK